MRSDCIWFKVFPAPQGHQLRAELAEALREAEEALHLLPPPYPYEPLYVPTVLSTVGPIGNTVGLFKILL